MIPWLLFVIVLLLFLLNVYFVLAPRNLFFTIVPEGRCKAVMKLGQFQKFLIQWRGHTFDSEWNVVEEEEEHHLFGGLRWVGIPPFWRIHEYEFSWTGVDVDGNLVPHKKEELDYVLLMEDVYWCKVSAAEDLNLLPLDIELLITMRVVNPYKAMFKVQNWNEMVMNRITPLLREYVAGVPYKELIQKKTEKKEEFYRKLNETAGRDFEENYGVCIINNGIEIKNIDPTPVEGIPSLREVTLRKYVAEQDRERVLVEADAERQRLGIIAKGEKDRVKTVYESVKEFGDLGKLIRTLEAVEKSPLASSLAVQAIPGLPEMLKGVFGVTSSEDEMKESLRQVIDLLKKQQQK